MFSSDFAWPISGLAVRSGGCACTPCPRFASLVALVSHGCPCASRSLSTTSGYVCTRCPAGHPSSRTLAAAVGTCCVRRACRRLRSALLSVSCRSGSVCWSRLPTQRHTNSASTHTRSDCCPWAPYCVQLMIIRAYCLDVSGPHRYIRWPWLSNRAQCSTFVGDRLLH